MSSKAFALLLLFSVPVLASDRQLPDASLETQLNRSYVELMELVPSWQYSKRDVKRARSNIEQERERRLEAAERLEERWRDELDAVRDQLEEMNRVSSRDTLEDSARRQVLHSRITGLEQSIRDKRLERERLIPGIFETKLAKLQLIEKWPSRREHVLREIEEGRARARKYGDVEDIGYREFVKDQEEDIEAGENAARQLMAEGRIAPELQDPEVGQYIYQLGQRIANSSDLKVPLHVAVLNSPEIHPIALPGGYLFLPSGLIRATRTESELVGVISREVARIAARHGVRASKPPLLSRIFHPLAQIATGLFTGGVTSPSAYYGISYGVQGLETLVDRAITNAPEKYRKEADQLGIQYAWNAGFDPRGFVSFLDLLTTRPESSLSIRSAEDANPEQVGERLVAAFSEVEYLPERESYQEDSPEFRAAKERLERNP